MIALYDLAQEIGKADFLAALELAAEQQMYGAEYLRAIVTLPSVSTPGQRTLQIHWVSQAHHNRKWSEIWRSMSAMLPIETACRKRNQCCKEDKHE